MTYVRSDAYILSPLENKEVGKDIKEMGVVRKDAIKQNVIPSIAEGSH